MMEHQMKAFENTISAANEIYDGGFSSEVGDVQALVDLFSISKEAIESLKKAQASLTSSLCDLIGELDSQSLVLANGTRVKRVNTWGRTSVDTQGLLDFIDDLSESLGERVTMVEDCFRLQPRWNSLKGLGINDEEFCVKERRSSIVVESSES